MTLRINRNLFLQTGADSAELGMLGAVVHPCDSPGDYQGTVYRGEQAVGEFTLRVVEESTPAQVQIDLAGQLLHGAELRNVSDDDDCGCDDKGSTGGSRAAYTLGRGGHAVFHVSGGSGGYAVALASPDSPRDDRGGGIWSSRELQKGDLFAVTLLRPGTYSVKSQPGGEGKLRMMYPERGKTPYRPPDPVRIAVTERGLEPAGFELQPMQGQVYEIQAPSRITISLVEPEDREQPPAPDRTGPARYSLRRRPEGANR